MLPPKQVLLACLSSTSPRSWINTLQRHLDELNLPDISTLAADTPSAGIWHRCVDRLIACQAQLNMREEAEGKKDLDPLIRCCTKPSVPAPYWKVTLTSNRKDPNYLSTNREHSTFQVYSPIKEATKRQDKMNEPDEAFPVFRALPIPCIILNANRRTKTGEAWERG